MIKYFCGFIERYFALLAILFSVAALIYPESFAWLRPHISILLGIIMFGMGITLNLNDLKGVWTLKRFVLSGVIMQYTIMPLLAIALSYTFDLSKEFAAGIIVVGSCPGGTSSNVMSYMARANLALSVTLTFITTLLAPLMTPLLIYMILHKTIYIPFLDMVMTTLGILIIPLILGILIKKLFYGKIKRVEPLFPAVSIICILAIIACVIALNQQLMFTLPVMLFLAVVIHNISGLILGYLIARILKADFKTAKTLAFEVGLQNSGLGVTLAASFFSAAVALPSTIFSIWHNLSGIFLAKYWATKDFSRKVKHSG